MRKNLAVFILSLAVIIGSALYYTSSVVCAQTQASQTQNVQQTVYLNTDPLELVKNPSKYLNKNVRMKATFDKFTNLGLDYKPALRSSQDYISFLILRSDVGENIIPLSEMKLFLTRKMAEKFIELEVGDKIQIEGTVFSSALSDTWIDVSRIVIIEKKKPKKV